MIQNEEALDVIVSVGNETSSSKLSLFVLALFSIVAVFFFVSTIFSYISAKITPYADQTEFRNALATHPEYFSSSNYEKIGYAAYYKFPYFPGYYCLVSPQRSDTSSQEVMFGNSSNTEQEICNYIFNYNVFTPLGVIPLPGFLFASIIIIFCHLVLLVTAKIRKLKDLFWLSFFVIILYIALLVISEIYVHYLIQSFYIL